MISHMTFRNCSILDWQKRLREMQNRYRCCQIPGAAGVWTFRIVSTEQTKSVIQVVDKNFEPSRGSVKPDAPYIFIRCIQRDDSVDVICKLRWQTWKIILIALCAILHLLLSVAHLYYEMLSQGHAYQAITLWLCLFIPFTIWIVKNILHDRLTLWVFCKMCGARESTGDGDKGTALLSPRKQMK